MLLLRLFFLTFTPWSMKMSGDPTSAVKIITEAWCLLSVCNSSLQFIVGLPLQSNTIVLFVHVLLNGDNVSKRRSLAELHS